MAESDMAKSKRKPKGAGDVWTWTAINAETKLIPCWFVGQRDAGCAYHFVHDLKARLSNRVQLTTDGHRAYLSAVEDAFGAEIDYAMLQKIYGARSRRQKLATVQQSAWVRVRLLSAVTQITTAFRPALRSVRI
jgi:transposase-like protein